MYRLSPATPSPTSTVPHQRMRQLIEYIESNLQDHLTLDVMAAQVGISPLYLARAFKGAIGQSPHQYVLMRRIERAKELLRKVQAAQHVASHPGEVCPAKWTPGQKTLAPSLDLVGKI